MDPFVTQEGGWLLSACLSLYRGQLQRSPGRTAVHHCCVMLENTERTREKEKEKGDEEEEGRRGREEAEDFLQVPWTASRAIPTG